MRYVSLAIIYFKTTSAWAAWSGRTVTVVTPANPFIVPTPTADNDVGECDPRGVGNCSVLREGASSCRPPTCFPSPAACPDERKCASRTTLPESGLTGTGIVDSPRMAQNAGASPGLCYGVKMSLLPPQRQFFIRLHLLLLIWTVGYSCRNLSAVPRDGRVSV